MSKKNLLHLLAIMMVAMLSVGLVSCGKDDDVVNPNNGQYTNPETSAADPEGTIIANLAIDKEISMGSLACNIKMTSANNLAVSTKYTDARITNVGNVKGLSSIITVPQIGWTSEIAAIVGQGYVIQVLYYPGRPTGYARLYVTDYIKNTSGSIIGCAIKYQEWNPTVQ